MEITKEKKENNNFISQNNQNYFNDKKIESNLNQYYKELKILVSKRPINAKGKSELSKFKKKIIDLIKDIFKENALIFCGIGNEIDLQLFIEYLCQSFEIKMEKMVAGYNLLEKIDKDQLLLLSKTKNTILSFLISFYDFYEGELVINNEEIVAEIINKKNTIEDSYIMALVKTVNLLNMPYITKDEFINIFKKDIKNKNFAKNLGYLLLKIIEFIFKIKNLNVNISKKKTSQKKVTNALDGNINKNNDQFSIFLGIFFEKNILSLVEFFSNVILEYDIQNTINRIIKKNELSVLLTNFNHIKIIRHKLFNFLCLSEKLFNNEQIMYIKNIVINNNFIEKILFFIHKDINNNKYFSFKDFLLEIKKIIKYYIICNMQSDEIEKKIINIISIGATKIKSKNIKNIKMQNNNDALFYFFKEINAIGKEEPEHKYKVYNFLISIFQASSLLRKYIYKELLNNFSGDNENYQDMLGHTNFLSVFVGSICKCDGNIIDYFFGFLHSLDKFKYFPTFELTNIISSLSCFVDAKSIQILINNLEIYNNELNANTYSKSDTNKKFNSKEIENSNEKKNLLEELNKSFLDIFSNIINEIINYYEEKKNNSNTIKNKNNENTEKKNKEQRNIFSSQMIFPLLEYISKIIQDDNIYQYFIEKNFIVSLNSLFNTNEHKIVAYKFIELLMKSSKNKDINEDRIKVILNRIDFILNKKDEQNKNKKNMDEFEKINELILILKIILTVFEYEIITDKKEDENKKIKTNIKKDIKENIYSGLIKCFNYFNDNKNNIVSIFNDKYHNLIKEYLYNFFILFIKSNQNCLDKKNINAPLLEKQQFELLINNILSLYKLILENKKINEKKNYFFYILIFLVNKSLNVKLSNKTKEENNDNNKQLQNNNDLYKYYINLYSIDEKKISDNSNCKNLYSNIYIYNPYLLTTILNYLIELNIYLDNFLNLIFLLCIINRGNISLLLRNKLLYLLLNISQKDSKYNDILYKIFQLCLPFIQKIDLILIFNFLIKSYNNNKFNFTKEIIQCLIESFQTICFSPKEYGKGIILCGYETKQSNIYNLINIKNVAFNNYINDSIIYVKQEIIFYE